MSTDLVMLSNQLILCCRLLLLPSVFLGIRVFCSELALPIRWPKYWSFSINPSSEYSGLVSSRIDWFDLLAVQGTLKSLLQHNLNPSVLWHSAFFYGPTLTSIHNYWKNHSFDYTDLCWQRDGSAFNSLSTFVTAFLSRSKYLLISWLQSPLAVILQPKKIKSVTISTFSPFYLL